MESNRKWHSCRLAVHGDSGRVRWCVGQERTWQTQLKRLVFLPAILLLVFLLYIFIAKFALAPKLEPKCAEVIEPPVYDNVEILDEEDRRDVLRVMKTSFAPADNILFSETKQRNRRDIKINNLNITGDGFSQEDNDKMSIDDAISFNLQLLLNEYNGNEEMETLFKILDKYEGHLIFWAKELKQDQIRKLQAKLMERYMDENVHPCNDFYKYACGNWQKYNPIPPEKATFDTFEILRQNLESVIRYLLENDSNDQTTLLNKILYAGNAMQLNSSLQRQIYQHRSKGSSRDAILKAKYLYKSCMNEEILNYRGIRPLLDLLDDLGGWPIIDATWKEETFDLIWLMGQLRRYNNDILISEWIGPDIKNSKEYVIQIDQTTLGLPSRDYFLDKVNVKYIEAYRDYMMQVAELLGSDPSIASQDADDVIKFETNLAMIVAGPESRRNVTEIYTKLTIEELHSLIPQINWPRYFDIVMQRRINPHQSIVCFSMTYLKNLVLLLEKTNSRTVANYLFWRFVRHRINNLDSRFDEIKQRFYYTLFGREKSPPRWQTCVAQVNSNLGMAIGGMFVEKFFDEDSKNDTMHMTRKLQESFRSILYHTNWLDDNTKILARLKIDNMHLRIGYPDFILSKEALAERYLDIKIHPDYYFENTLSVLKHLTRLEQSRLGTPVNKSLWNTPPAVVNAYYSRNKNQIMFPAGILQPPFYHKYFPRSVNYGGIGVVIGHEITHGFDDKGRLFDRQGNLQRWWKDVSVEEFHARAQCLIAQYNSYTIPEINEALDGLSTQGENIADNGGLKQAFKAYNQWLDQHPDADETLPGLNFTNQQLFFLNFAQVWCGTSRPQASRSKLKTAVHSPGRFRVIGALTNSEEFANTFNCPLGSPMNPVSKCRIW